MVNTAPLYLQINGVNMLAQMNPTFIGFGSQTRAWISNLRDSNIEAQVFLRKDSSSYELVSQKGFSLCEDLKSSKLIFLLIPDAEHLNFLQTYKDQISQGAVIIVAHGASITEHSLPELFPQWSFNLLAIKAIASEIRYQYEQKGKLGAVYCLSSNELGGPNPSKDLILKLSQALGVTAGPFEVTFEQEARADLFSEQSLLCGLLPYAAKQSYDLLRSHDIPKELAFMECWLEVKLIADAMVKMGPEEFFKLISPHALVGSEFAQERIFDKEQQRIIEDMRHNIWNGDFFKEVQETDIEAVRARVLQRWSSSEIQDTFNQLKKDLIPK